MRAIIHKKAHKAIAFCSSNVRIIWKDEKKCASALGGVHPAIFITLSTLRTFSIESVENISSLSSQR